MSLDTFDEGRIVSGRVKWFDPIKGFGFVVSDEQGPDILLHANVLRNFGQNSVADGTEVELLVQQTERGLQALAIHALKLGSTPQATGLADFAEIDPDVLAAAPLEPARVKWFDRIKGFGFATVFGRCEDVFVHIEVLRASGLAELAPGEAVCIRAIDGKRGKMATAILPWDAALTPETAKARVVAF